MMAARMLSHLLLEWAGMSLGRENRVEVEIVQDDLVPGVGQILYHVFQLIADAFYLVVGLVSEEHIDEVRKLLQLVYLIIYSDVAVQLLQSLRASLVYFGSSMITSLPKMWRLIRRPSSFMKKSCIAPC